MRNFYGDLLCECESVEFERIALTTPDGVMAVSHVMATCISCSFVLHAETDPHVEDLEVADTSPVLDCCLWSTERYQRGYAGVVRNVRAVVHGHRVVKHPRTLGNVHFIDTAGWKPGGYFTFLGLEIMKPAFGPVALGHAPSRRNR